MDYFSAFTSCTAAGSGSQNWFAPDDPNGRIACRVYYRLSRDVHTCALLYSNLIDSTFADGAHSRSGFVPGPWRIHALRAGVVSACGLDEAAEPAAFAQVTFSGCETRDVNPGEIFSTDPFNLSGRKGEYLCVETVFSGARVPCHTESLLPAFRLSGGVWEHSTDIPFPSMVGAARGEEFRLGFWGDSITQGIGTPPNSYAHVTALVQEALGAKCAVWNLGLGYGRAHDAALDGGWAYKARQNDAVCVCFGVNDILHDGRSDQLMADLEHIVRGLKEGGVKVVIQTVPPFDYNPEQAERWARVNGFIRNDLARAADAVFDTVPVLSKGPDMPHMARYGAHPDEEGNAAWARALLPLIEQML